nr:MAG TPA: hypothetical protein [Caudoviricetes sp.]
MSNFRPRLFAPTMGGSPMKNLLQHKTRLMLLGAMLCVVSDDLDRVQRAYQDRERRASADACRVERAAIARCEVLLGESAELLAEGSDLLQRNAGVHDATVSLEK